MLLGLIKSPKSLNELALGKPQTCLKSLYDGMPWSLPLLILTAAKSKAITELSESLNSNKWFWRTSAMLVSNLDGGSLIKLRNMDSIPPFAALFINWVIKLDCLFLFLRKYSLNYLYASSGLNIVSDKLTLGAMFRLFRSKRPKLFLTSVWPNLKAAVANSLETAGLSFKKYKHI